MDITCAQQRGNPLAGDLRLKKAGKETDREKEDGELEEVHSEAHRPDRAARNHVVGLSR